MSYSFLQVSEEWKETQAYKECEFPHYHLEKATGEVLDVKRKYHMISGKPIIP